VKQGEFETVDLDSDIFDLVAAATSTVGRPFLTAIYTVQRPRYVSVSSIERVLRETPISANSGNTTSPTAHQK
jgi:hypothetical protein